MRRRPLFRVIALIAALLGSFASPAQALAHGHVHAHLSLDHGLHVEDARASVATLETADDDHAHGHERLDAVEGARDLSRLRVAAPPLDFIVPGDNTALAPATTLAPTRTDRVLLARPGPERGPPPTLRAPPLR